MGKTVSKIFTSSKGRNGTKGSKWDSVKFGLVRDGSGDKGEVDG